VAQFNTADGFSEWLASFTAALNEAAGR